MLETKLADDPVYQQYQSKFERLELLNEKLNSKLLTESEKKKLLEKKKKLKLEFDLTQEKLRSIIVLRT